jgi:hypothetical protein
MNFKIHVCPSDVNNFVDI